MNKIPCLFKRDFSTRPPVISGEVTEGCEWVIKGEGTASIKYDGTCCLIENGKLFKRYDAKHGKKPPSNFIPAQPEPDSVTGHWPGWLPVGDEPESKYHKAVDIEGLRDDTYELVGPQFQGNPYQLKENKLWRHGSSPISNPPRDLESIKAYLAAPGREIEGIVFLHPDGRMAKIRSADFGIDWKPKASFDF